MDTVSIELDAVRRVLEPLIAERMSVGDDGTERDISVYAVGEATSMMLADAARAVHADSMIEIGMASGLSTLAMCAGRGEAGPMRAGSFHVIDPCQAEFRNIGLLNLERAGVERAVMFHALPSHRALPRLLEQGVRIQFAFVDGLHFLDHVMNDLFYLDQMLDVGGVIALHDLWMPGIQHSVSYWLANRAYTPVTLRDGAFTTEPYPENRGCGDEAKQSPYFRKHVEPFVDWHTLMIRKVAEDDRVWDAFEDFVEG